MNKNIIQIHKKFKLRDSYEKSVGKSIQSNPQEYQEWLECQLILERESNGITMMILENEKKPFDYDSCPSIFKEIEEENEQLTT